MCARTVLAAVGLVAVAVRFREVFLFGQRMGLYARTVLAVSPAVLPLAFVYLDLKDFLVGQTWLLSLSVDYLWQSLDSAVD